MKLLLAVFTILTVQHALASETLNRYELSQAAHCSNGNSIQLVNPTLISHLNFTQGQKEMGARLMDQSDVSFRMIYLGKSKISKNAVYQAVLLTEMTQQTFSLEVSNDGKTLIVRSQDFANEACGGGFVVTQWAAI